MRPALLLLTCILICCISLRAQDPNATVSGRVLDPSGAVVPGTQVTVINDATGIGYPTVANDAGIYSIGSVPPGNYHIQVSKNGFKNMVKPDVILHVQDALTINFTLEIGAASESVTVEGGAPLVNTESAAVSTVVDRQFVENIPLNGRSFQTLIMLTPGVVLTPANGASPGQFSVNGQRSNSNYFAVDGVSANIGIGPPGGLGQTAGGAIPGFGVTGGTNTLVSVDALQEFRIQTSSFAPEFGNMPGGQVSIVTRSGTNQFHGTLFEYFRNDVLDANDWFANRDGLRKPPERQNDFGGVIGGPVIKEKTFFFFSYEGLRLRQPKTRETQVPDTAVRQAASAAIQPFLNAFPVQNGPELGNDLAKFNATFSSASTLNAYSLRIDHNINSKLSLFARYNYAPSQVVTPAGPLSQTVLFSADTQTFTLGLTAALSQKIGNELRANYSNYRSGQVDHLTNFGGAVPLPESGLFPSGFSSANGGYQFLDIVTGLSYDFGNSGINEQRQVNLVDNLAVSTGAHQLKFGVDYRWLAPFSAPQAYLHTDFFAGLTGPPGSVLSGTDLAVEFNGQQANALLARNFSLYGQDTWKATSRLTLTYGLRWDINPPLKGKNRDSEPFTVTGLNDPATISLAPRGTPLYSTTYGNVAPRVGLAYQVRQSQGWETVVRAGFGVFYDLGTGSLGNVTQGFPYTAQAFAFGVPFPTPPQPPAPFSLTLPTGSQLYVSIPGLQLPRTYQWNAAAEQGLGSTATLSVTYIGAHGRDLLRPYVILNNPNITGGLYVTTNSGSSNYNALQIKYQRQLSRGLQALASYSFSHSIDNSSNDSAVFTTPALANSNVDRGNSDFDVRHSFTGALTYNIPFPRSAKLGRAILGNWSAHTFVLARSALPVNIYGAPTLVGGVESQARPNVVSGIPLYLYGPQFPGGRAINGTPNQGGSGCFGPFCPAPAGQQGDFGRNVLRGFGAWQADFALHRQFPITERISLQFRTEFFNIFNHPNFGDPTMTNRLIANPQFGQSTESLANSLGSGGPDGGFNPLYQIGGSRSVQFALKVNF
jgi:Carboxypeptidase regulatory-like domain/TonB dependent receptor